MYILEYFIIVSLHLFIVNVDAFCYLPDKSGRVLNQNVGEESIDYSTWFTFTALVVVDLWSSEIVRELNQNLGEENHCLLN